MNIVIANRKGGVGKSTLATNLAVEYSKRLGSTIIIDTDVSQTSLKFIERRKELELDDDNLRIALPETMEDLEEIMLDKGISDFKIVDVGGYSDALAMTAIVNSDLLVVPVSASPQDKDTTLQFIDTIKTMQADKFLGDCIFVLNNTHPLANFDNLAKKVAYIREAGFDLYGAIGHYSIFEHAHGGGLSVNEINPKCEASKSILLLINAIQGRFDER
jgi:chromosome partitioning protein